MNNIKEMDPLRRENWAELYSAVPDEVDAGVKLAFARIRRREQRRKQIVRAAACAACIALVAGVSVFALTGRQEPDAPDRVAEGVAAAKLISGSDVVFASRDDACFHIPAGCPSAKGNAVELQLVTALEFEKKLCGVCGANVQIAP